MELTAKQQQRLEKFTKTAYNKFKNYFGKNFPEIVSTVEVKPIIWKEVLCGFSVEVNFMNGKCLTSDVGWNWKDPLTHGTLNMLCSNIYNKYDQEFRPNFYKKSVQQRVNYFNTWMFGG